MKKIANFILALNVGFFGTSLFITNTSDLTVITGIVFGSLVICWILTMIPEDD